MKTTKTFIILAAVFLTLSSSRLGQAQERTALTAEQQTKFLAQRLPAGQIMGNFGSFGSFLIAALGIAIHTDCKEIGDTKLNSPFPDFYKPTIRELLDTIALQTKSSWKYDPARDYWVFTRPATAKPFATTLADKWVSEDRGIYTSFRPPTYPVGMDIYYYGVYSADDRQHEAALWEKIRNSWAIGYASYFKKDVSIAEMQRINVAGVEALYFQTPTPRPGLILRFWSLVKDGKAFVIVSTLPAEDKKLLSDVESMVKSFHLVP